MSVAPSNPASAPPAPVIQKETTVGNYFISNYPPFSAWKTEDVPAFEDALKRAPKPDVPLGVYLHIPFCRKRCHFCYFRVYTDKDSAAIRGYIDAAIQELAIYAGMPFIGGRKPRFIYFGGGTPSYLSVDQLQHLTRSMRDLLPWDEAEEVTFEAEPGTLTDHKLKAIREMGVTRLSLGVENFDDHILEINGRAHQSREIERAYRYAREVGFPQINVDLIAGMVEETESNWRECVRKTIEMDPDSVTVYQMEVPYNTTIYRQMKAEGKLAAPVADWDTKRGWVRYAFSEFEKAGYTVSSAYTVVKSKERTRFVYRDRLWAGADLLGLGVASFGHIGGTHYQNEHDFDPYLKAVQAGRSPVHRALTPTADERLIREFILQLKTGGVKASYYQGKFGVDPRARFAAPLATLAQWGFARVDGDDIRLNRDGLLQVDRLLHEFFLPEHRNVRYA
ncbi:MAG: coproporphyrinogen III oxidase family protein [Verrucomicrobia bacterium]|nr:coproporphyrinogen III oxidase family protein [Verrucomicrobiota bacterium]MBI3868065.1 coproporphyrinogen III oxidase family protein [Verrucomicrobiota bacterium]